MERVGSPRVPQGGVCVLERSIGRRPVACERQGRPPGRFGKLALHPDCRPDIMRVEQAIPLQELAAAVALTQGVRAQFLTPRRALYRAGFSYGKKDALHLIGIGPRDSKHVGLGSRAVSQRCGKGPHMLVFIPSRQIAP